MMPCATPAQLSPFALCWGSRRDRRHRHLAPRPFFAAGAEPAQGVGGGLALVVRGEVGLEVAARALPEEAVAGLAVARVGVQGRRGLVGSGEREPDLRAGDALGLAAARVRGSGRDRRASGATSGLSAGIVRDPAGASRLAARSAAFRHAPAALRTHDAGFPRCVAERRRRVAGSIGARPRESNGSPLRGTEAGS